MAADYRRPWTPEEDSAIKQLVEELGTKNWSLIASELIKRYSIKHRSGKQCRERWHNHLDSSIDKKPWTQEEDDLIFELHKLHGKSWSKIAENIPGRTDNSVKNRFYSTLRRNLRKYNKSRPHSQRLIGSVRTILRNPDIPDLLLREQAPARLKKGRKIDEKDEGEVKNAGGPEVNLEVCTDFGGVEEKQGKKMIEEPKVIVSVPSQKVENKSKAQGFEKVLSGVEDANLLINLSQPELNYFFFYPQAMANYKGMANFPPFMCPVFPPGLVKAPYPTPTPTPSNINQDSHSHTN